MRLLHVNVPKTRVEAPASEHLLLRQYYSYISGVRCARTPGKTVLMRRARSC